MEHNFLTIIFHLPVQWKQYSRRVSLLYIISGKINRAYALKIVKNRECIYFLICFYYSQKVFEYPSSGTVHGCQKHILCDAKQVEHMSLSQNPWFFFWWNIYYCHLLHKGDYCWNPHQKRAERKFWDFPGGPVVNTVLPLQRALVQSLIRELRSHMPDVAAKKRKEKWRLCHQSLALQAKPASSNGARKSLILHVSGFPAFCSCKKQGVISQFSFWFKYSHSRTGSFERQWDSRCSWLRMQSSLLRRKRKHLKQPP